MAHGVDPESVIAIITQTFQRISIQRPSALDDPDLAVQPLSETLLKVLVALPARELGMADTLVDAKVDGPMSTAMYVAFDFALRCVSAVLAEPLANHYEGFSEAARSSASLLWIELDDPAGLSVEAAPTSGNGRLAGRRGKRDGSR